MPKPIIPKCCCCASLEAGGYIISIMGIVISLKAILIFAIILGITDYWIPGAESEPTGLMYWLRVMNILFLVYFCKFKKQKQNILK